MEKGLCRFCGEDKNLIKAHVVPEPFYNYFLSPDEKNKLIIVDKRSPYTNKSPIGCYDHQILCKECDGEFGLYDEEAIKLLLSDLAPYKREEAYIVPPEKYNYQKLKLFFISMLWRASISSNQSFEHVKLGDKCEKLAQAILCEPKLDRDDLFPVFIFKLKRMQNSPIQKVFIDPIPYCLADVKMYKFVFAGYSFHIKVDERELLPLFSRIILRRNSELVIVEKLPGEELSDMSVIFDGHKSLKDKCILKKLI